MGLTIPSLYEKQDIYPTLVRIFNKGGRILFKLENKQTNVEIRFMISENDVALYRKFILERKENKLSTGKIVIEKDIIDAQTNECRYYVVGYIQIKNMTIIGTVLNPFSSAFMQIMNSVKYYYKDKKKREEYF